MKTAEESKSGVNFLTNQTAKIGNYRNPAFIFHSRRSDNSEEPDGIVPRRVRRGDNSEVPHRRDSEFGANGDLHSGSGIGCNAFIQDSNQTALFLKHLEQVLHSIHIRKFRLVENVGGALNEYIFG